MTPRDHVPFTPYRTNGNGTTRKRPHPPGPAPSRRRRRLYTAVSRALLALSVQKVPGRYHTTVCACFYEVRLFRRFRNPPSSVTSSVSFYTAINHFSGRMTSSLPASSISRRENCSQSRCRGGTFTTRARFFTDYTQNVTSRRERSWPAIATPRC